MAKLSSDYPAYVATAALSALLLFSVQPLVGKSLLPWFGGSPAVWTTAMMFFQALLLIGYAYAHLIAVALPPRGQLVAHGLVLAAGFASARILPGASWAPAGDADPSLSLLVILGAHAAGPFLALSATAPLFQSWFSRRFPERSPYPLYAVSNGGSLLAVLSYPFVIEPLWSLGEQRALWLAGYALFLGLFLVVAARLWRTTGMEAAQSPRETALDKLPEAKPPVRWSWSWLTLPACGTVALLATTEQISQDVAASPLFWVVPLAVYLISFIIGFQGGRLYARRLFLALLPLATVAIAALLILEGRAPTAIQLALYTGALLIGCTVCHGELYRLRPDPTRLTRFYLAVSAGGALGGALVALAAPLLLPDLWEFSLGWLALSTLILAALRRQEADVFETRLPTWAVAGVAVSVIVSGICVGADFILDHRGTDVVSRSFYGRLAVSTQRDMVCLHHGRIRHGCQWRDPDRAGLPATYYLEDSGVGLALAALRDDPERSDKNLRIGVVGLGIGTCASWGRAGDQIRFYELDPHVLELAKTRFSYLENSAATIDVSLGDARLSLARENDREEPSLDLLILDAFSGDAIPLHLLTHEAQAVYRKRLGPHSILAVHISNRHVALEPVLLSAARETGRAPLLIYTEDDRETMSFASTWILIAANERLEEKLRSSGHVEPWPKEYSEPVTFTDQRSDLLRVLSW